MANLIIPYFIHFQGCPERCIYCTRYEDSSTQKSFQETMEFYLNSQKAKTAARIEVAFYGGNFTGIPYEKQLEYLQAVQNYILTGKVQSIRISTRPDYISSKVVKDLKQCGVTYIELGVQSLVDDVLQIAKRGHTRGDIERATQIIKQEGLHVGYHLMVGLPGDNDSKFDQTIQQTITLRPCSVRIHPTLVFADTELAQMFYAGKYQPLDLLTAIQLCKRAVVAFESHGISVIRIGLQETEIMGQIKHLVAGPHHPAFGSLVRESIYFDKVAEIVEKNNFKAVRIRVCNKDESFVRGEKNRNLIELKQRYSLMDIEIVIDGSLQRGELRVEKKEKVDAL